jgi:haloalkane dehalogenase
MFATAGLSKSHQLVDGKRMAFHERGEGDAIVFLHGNPTSSYLWRNVVPHVAEQGRCIAPDLIGMGDSDKLDAPGPASYSFFEHRHYVDGLLDQLGLGDRVTLVLHDWGSLLGFDWARRHPERVAGIAYMEAFVRPLAWDEFPQIGRPIFQAFRSDTGEELILEKNAFVEGVLPAGVMRELTEEEMAEYRRPFATPGEDRRPTLSWPRQLPLRRDPAEVVHPAADEVLQLVEVCGRWMAQAEIPKLFVNVDPGANLAGPQREFCRRWPDQTEVTVPGIHYVQEDNPHLVGSALSRWLAEAVHAHGTSQGSGGANSRSGLAPPEARRARGCRSRPPASERR